MESTGFNPPAVTCRKCGDSIKSSYSGEWVTCKCKAIYVDQTRHYSRYGGNPEDFIFEKEENTDHNRG